MGRAREDKRGRGGRLMQAEPWAFEARCRYGRQSPGPLMFTTAARKVGRCMIRLPHTVLFSICNSHVLPYIANGPTKNKDKTSCLFSLPLIISPLLPSTIKQAKQKQKIKKTGKVVTNQPARPIISSDAFQTPTPPMTSSTLRLILSSLCTSVSTSTTLSILLSLPPNPSRQAH